MDKNFIVDEENRLDKFLTLHISSSRNQIEHLIKKGFVSVDGKNITKTGLKLKLNQNIKVIFPENKIDEIKNEKFIKTSLKDKVITKIYEDDFILVINKPSNLVIHDAPSVKEATLVDWLRLNKISLSTLSADIRHGIVHRLDKGTSGVMVIAKTNEAHTNLSEQLKNKTMGRYYLALIDLALKDNIIINKPISRHVNNRLKMGINSKGKYAKSAFRKLSLCKNEKYELISCKLFTGRTHQIRVHLSSINRHILGDALYGFKGNFNRINRFYLHSYNLYLIHPHSGEEMNFTASLADDMNCFIKNNFNMENIHEKLSKDHIINSFNDFD